MNELRIFVSSPGDVAEERALTERVIGRLQGEFSHRARLVPIFWEHEPLLATATFQDQIPRPSASDIMVCILWSRLGTRLPGQFRREDGSAYRSGTEFEFEDAVRSRQAEGRPDLLVYRKTTEPLVSLRDEDALLERIRQRKALDEFVERWFHDRAAGTLIAAFHPFAQSNDYEELLEIHLRKLIQRRLPALEAPVAPGAVQWSKGSPYRGLEVFDFEHAPVFFGRSKAVAEVFDALRRQAAAGRAFVLVLGMSGSGKSSLVRAGVLPLLVQPGVVENVGLWRRAVLRPSDGAGDLFDVLAAALLRPEALPELGADGTGAPALAAQLRANAPAAALLIQGALSHAAGLIAAQHGLARQPEARLVIVIDQLEEIFTHPRLTAAERTAWITAIGSFARSGRAWVVATLRSDFYARCAELPELINLKEGAGQYDLLLPSGAEIGQMIRQPALAAGLRFEVDPQSQLGLDEVLRDAALCDPAALPLLEFCLEELYGERTPEGRLTFAAHEKMGGVEGALARRAEEVFAALSPAAQQAFDRVWRQLVTV